jgi:hypothetical protein
MGYRLAKIRLGGAIMPPHRVFAPTEGAVRFDRPCLEQSGEWLFGDILKPRLALLDDLARKLLRCLHPRIDLAIDVML